MVLFWTASASDLLLRLDPLFPESTFDSGGSSLRTTVRGARLVPN